MDQTNIFEDTGKQSKIPIIAVVGPTASGKSSLAIKIAKKYNGEIICCDSMQIYRGMDIGTAKPTAEERSCVPHRLFDIADARSGYSCADYATDASKQIKDTHSRAMLPVLCGGTGLYLDSLLTPRSYFSSSGRTAVRDELEAIAATDGGQKKLHQMLREADPESAEAIHENNVRRVIRALEIYKETGIKKSELDRISREQANSSDYCATVIGLRYPDRSLLRKRITKRVDIMLAEGLADEVRRLDKEGVFSPLPDDTPSTAAQAIGYKEMLFAIRNGEDLSEAREKVITATCRYAKRQMTWFGAKPYVNWIDITQEDQDPSSQAFELIDKAIVH